jgi:peptidoglycan hydrolase-like protein with peptidoglycan-binding domain
MEKGSTGPAVGVLQIILKVLNCNGAIKIDMGFGNETKKGVKVLQESYGLEVDGKCGPDTREKIREETGIDLNVLPADLFKGETVTVPPEPWVALPMS